MLKLLFAADVVILVRLICMGNEGGEGSEAAFVAGSSSIPSKGINWKNNSVWQTQKIENAFLRDAEGKLSVSTWHFNVI